jgi:hypothetical protein
VKSSAALAVVPDAPPPPPRPSVAGRPHDPAVRGFYAVYRIGEVNRCPGCGRAHWWIGRTMAECAFCETALSLVREVP